MFIRSPKSMYKKNIIIKIVAVSIVFLFLISGLSALTYGTQTSNKPTYNSLENIIPNKIPKTLLNKTNNNYQPVNPFSLYSKEPAPMGIADYGIGPNNQPYAYETPEFLGVINVNKLETYNASLNQSAYWMTFQLNVNLIFENGNTQYVYWIQDVAFVNTLDNYVQFIDNIWNSSSPDANMLDSTVLGNGTVGNSSGTGFYYDWANQYLSGNDISLSYPYNIQLEVFSYINAEGYPAVAFLYNDGYGWVTYDNANFVFASDLTSYPEFLVDGYQYTPVGNFYDAELILGGPGGGTQTYDVSSSLTLQLEYWNGNNFQMIDNAYNFGSDTAEGISNVSSDWGFYTNNGTLSEILFNFPGQPGELYDADNVATLRVNSPLTSGILYVNNSAYQFINGIVNITIGPGNYPLFLYNSQGQLVWSKYIYLYAGEYLNLSTAASTYFVSFRESGLPSRTTWYVEIYNSSGSLLGTQYSNTSEITFAEPLVNGTYYYSVGTFNTNFKPSVSLGSFTINGATMIVLVSFVEKEYSITFIENGLPDGTYWSISLTGYIYNYTSNGTTRESVTESSTSNEIIFKVYPGFYIYQVDYINGYIPTVPANGGNVTQNVTQYVTFVKNQNKYVQVGNIPQYALYDPLNNLIYVSNFNSSSISVINGTNVIGAIATTQYPESMVIDPNNGLIYVLMGSGGIDVLNTVGNYATLILKNYYFNNLIFDPSNGYLYASGYDNLTVINPLNEQVINVVPVSLFIAEMTLDQGNGYLYVLSGMNVTVLNPSNGNVIAIINLNYFPSWIEYDQFNGDIYVSEDNFNANAIGLNVYSSTGYVAVISGFSIVKQINVGYYPILSSINPLNGDLFVSNIFSDSIQVISSSNNSIINSIPVYVPGFSVFDPSNSMLYVVSLGINYVFFIPMEQKYVVTFSNMGLPNGTTWYVNISNEGSFKSRNSTIILSLPDGNYSYTVSSSDKEYAPAHPTGSFKVNGANVNIAVPFYLVTFSITFTESGLPSGTLWFITLNGITHNSTTNTITFTEPNGSYSYTIETPISGGTGIQYVLSQSTGTLTVNGADININVPYTTQYYLTIIASPSNGGTVSPSSGWYNAGSSVTIDAISNSNFEFVSWSGTGNGSYSGTNNPVSITINGPITETANFIELYKITFVETGLPPGTAWYVNLSNGQSYNTTGNSIEIQIPNGSYSYMIATTNKEYSAQGGSLIVNGANMEISIKFNLVTYAITFTESGLSSGTSWSVILNNIEKSSTNGTIIFNEPNGTYSYVISGISGYRTNTYSGTISVNGNSVSVPINWTIITYTITITENGIPNGTSWSATLTGTTFNGQYINVTLSSTTNTITFNEPNGTYSYIIHLPSGYQSNSVKGQVNVSGNSAIATIKAQQTTNYLWIGIIAVVIIIVILLAVAFLIRNRNKQRITK